MEKYHEIDGQLWQLVPVIPDRNILDDAKIYEDEIQCNSCWGGSCSHTKIISTDMARVLWKRMLESSPSPCKK